MAKSNRRPFFRAYLNDFHPTADGSFVYAGTSLHWDPIGISRAKALFLFWGLALVQAAAAVVCGCIPAPGMLNCFWVILPYIASVTALFLLIWALVRLTLSGDPLREYVHRATVQRFPVLTGACLASCALAGLAEAVYLLVYGAAGQAMQAVLFLLGQAIGVICPLLWRRLCGRLRWQAV